MGLCRTAHGGSQLDQPKVSVPGVAAVADHARDAEPAIAHPVAPVHLLTGEAGHDPQHPPPDQDRLLRLIFRAGRRRRGRPGPPAPRSRPESGGSASSSSSCSGSSPAARRAPESVRPGRRGPPSWRSRGVQTQPPGCRPGVSQRASSGHSDRTCCGGETVEEDLSADHLPSGPGAQPRHRPSRQRSNHPASRPAISCVDGPAALRRVQAGAYRSAEAVHPRPGGTALPICRNAADGGPANRNRSGKVCSRAASRTVRVRFCRGWMYQ